MVSSTRCLQQRPRTDYSSAQSNQNRLCSSMMINTIEGNAGPDQTARMRMLIWFFTTCIWQKGPFACHARKKYTELISQYKPGPSLLANQVSVLMVYNVVWYVIRYLLL